MNLYKLYPLSPFTRFRTSHDGLDISDGMIHSDTLFSALVNVHAQAYGKESTDQWVKTFEKGEAGISSAFVGLQKGEERIYFLPRPTMLFAHELNPDNRKRTKSMQWVSRGLLLEILKAYCPENKLSTFEFSESLVSKSDDEKFWALKTESETIPRLLHRQVKPGLEISRETGGAVDGMLYNQADWVLSAEVDGWRPFLYVLAKGDNLDRVETCLRLLADTGIGGKRSTGAGQLSKVELAGKWDWRPSSNHSLAYQLSLYNPGDGEGEKLQFYELLTRAGHFGSLDHKQMNHVNMVAEGAITGPDTKGRMVELSAEPPVLRYGKSLTLEF